MRIQTTNKVVIQNAFLLFLSSCNMGMRPVLMPWPRLWLCCLNTYRRLFRGIVWIGKPLVHRPVRPVPVFLFFLAKDDAVRDKNKYSAAMHRTRRLAKLSARWNHDFPSMRGIINNVNVVSIYCPNDVSRILVSWVRTSQRWEQILQN